MRVITDSLRKRVSSVEVLQLLIALSLATGLIAHVVLDGVANVALPHDPYDDVVHGTRVPVLLIVTIATVVGAVRASLRLLADAAAGTYGARLPALIRIPFGALASAVAFFGSVVLALIEASDTFVARDAIPGLDDLFAGSMPLAFVVVCATAALLCAGARFSSRKLLALRPSLVRALAIFFAAFVRLKVSFASHTGTLPCDTLRLRDPLSVRAGKRAPPPLSIG